MISITNIIRILKSKITWAFYFRVKNMSFNREKREL